MTDRLIKVMESGRLVCRGLSNRKAFEASLPIDENDTVKLTIDWTGWLNGDTIASVANTVTGSIALSGAATATPQHTVKVSGSGSGLIEHRMTTTTSAETKEIRIWVPVNGVQISDDYGCR